MIKTIIFDNGGVLVKDSWLTFVSVVSKSCNISEDELYKNLYPLERMAVLGDISFTELLKRLSESGYNNYLAILKEKNDIYPEARYQLSALKKKYELALLSNDLGDFDEKNLLWQLEKYMGDNIFHSSALGLGKPDVKIFELVLKKINRDPKEVIFIDDKQRNLDTARSLGMNVIQFKSLEQLRDDLNEMLKEQNG